MKIDHREVGDGAPVFVVAEISCNHEGEKAKALQLIEYAKNAGADAVKFQLWMDPAEMAPDSDDPRFRLHAGPWAGMKLYDLYTQAWTPPDWFPALFARARERELIPFASVFSPDAVDYLETLDCPAYKIASPELPWTALIHKAAMTDKPVIVSTGMASLTELKEVAKRLRVDRGLLLHCLAAYPAPAHQMNLTRMTWLERQFGFPVGLSDHSLDNTAAIASVALGASLIEKHLMLPWPTNSLDKDFAIDPVEFHDLVVDIREAEDALLPVDGPHPAEKTSRGFRRRLVGDQWVRCSS